MGEDWEWDRTVEFSMGKAHICLTVRTTSAESLPDKV